MEFSPLERLHPPRPVDRLDFIQSAADGQRVLDLGAYDETALAKRDTALWLHGRLAKVATEVLGIDSSAQLPPMGVATFDNARILRGTVLDHEGAIRDFAPTLVVAGELIEHLSSTIRFLTELGEMLPGVRFLATTPNATSFHNVVLGVANRESTHEDHLQIYSYKTLHTLFTRAGLQVDGLTPYYASFAEMELRSASPIREMVRMAERGARAIQWLFPMLAGGWVVTTRL
jgi:hypothetical protein